MLRLVAIVILLSATAFPACAQTLDPLTDAQSAYSWSGFYIGTQGGWGWADQDLEDAAGLDGTVELNGAFFGPLAGFQKQWDNNFVLGAEIEANWSDIDGQDSLPGAVGRTFGAVEIFGSIGLKAGYAWNRFLVYGSGGLAGAETESLQRNGPLSSSDHAVSFGWMGGVGVDYALTDQIILGLQYRHYDLGEADYDMGFLPDRTGEVDLDTISGHFTVRFGGL
jgi:outer membrane immunogenic protein